MDDRDRELLNVLQAEFPVVSRPYQSLAERLGTTESDILSRVRRLAESGVIRKIGPMFDTRKLGHSSVLVAMRVPSDRLDEVVAVVNSYPQVTHNYGREHEYNLWFTLICQDDEGVRRVLAEISGRTGIQDVHVLPADRIFKIGVSFDF